MTGRWWPAPAAVLAGGLLYWGWAPRSLWWTAPAAFAVLWIVLRGSRARVGAALGIAAGSGFFVPLLSWTGEFVGQVPWLALAAVQASFIGVAGAGVAVVSRLPAGPVWAAFVWIAVEDLRSRVPFGGFPWGRVAFGQEEGPFLPLVAVGGTALLGLAVVLTGFLLGEAAMATGRSCGRVPRAVPMAAVLVLLGVVAAGPLGDPGDPERTVRIALIQGNVPRLGLDFNSQRRAVLTNHSARTQQLARDVRAGRVPRPDLVVWPENSADVDPLRDPLARRLVEDAVRSIGVPVLIGAVLTPPGARPTNTLIAWDPVRGPGDVHDKRRLQPFGEYVPYRSLFRRFNGYVDRASDFRPGEGTGAMDLGPVRVGVATCYEVLFDDLVRQSVRSGARVLVVPSNNATFGRTDMTYQQLAISRVRAVETGRAVVVPTTSGVSAVIRPDGTVAERSGMFTSAAIVADLPVLTRRTPAILFGGPVSLIIDGLALGAAVISIRCRSRTGPVPPVGFTAVSAGPVDPA